MKKPSTRFRHATFAVFLLAPVLSNAGYKQLVVPFFDYSSTKIGRTSFKSLRLSGYQVPCWLNHHENIRGISQAYIENPPRSLDPQALLEATRGSRSAATAFASQLAGEKMDGAYAFIPDPSGRFATIYGIGARDGAVTAASIAVGRDVMLSIPILSQALCDAAASMD